MYNTDCLYLYKCKTITTFVSPSIHTHAQTPTAVPVLLLHPHKLQANYLQGKFM